MKLKYYHDAGHGWIAVKKSVLEKLGIADKITSYSYMKGATAYVEEDSDASLLIKTLKSEGVEPVIAEKYVGNYSPIRSYDRYEFGS